MAHHGSRGKKVLITAYLWCAIGAAIGWMASYLGTAGTRLTRIEEVLVGVFGAFIGGEFVASLVFPKASGGFHVGALLMGIAGAVAMIALLHFMRRAVGPLKRGRSRAEGRRR